MRTIFKVVIWSIVIYGVINIAYERGYKKTTEKDFILDDPQDTIIYMDTIPAKRVIRDTTPYHGKWIDVN